MRINMSGPLMKVTFLNKKVRLHVSDVSNVESGEMQRLTCGGCGCFATMLKWQSSMDR